MRKPTIPQEHHTIIYDMWKEGITRKEIGAQFGVHENVIWHIVKKLNGGTANQRNSKVYPSQETLYEQYVLQDRQQKDIAEEHGVDINVIKRLLKEYGLSKRKMYKREVPSDDALYTDYILEDMTQQEIAVKYDASPSQVSWWLKNAELKKRDA